MKNTFDRTVFSLCAEIDQLKQEVEYWREMYEQERQMNISQSNERLVDAQKCVANALMFAFACRDDENGNLVIDRQSRKGLAENFK